MLLRFGMAALCGLLGGAASASAHVVLEKSEASSGTFYKAVLKVTHGCEGSPTVKVEVALPEGVIAARPMPKAGWQIELGKGDFARTYKFHGRDVGQGVKTITWTGGTLPDDYFDEFVFSAYLAGETPAPAVLYFPVTQTCEKGEMRWAQVPTGGQGKLDWPAPTLKLLKNSDSGQNATIAVEDAWSRATAAKATVGVGFATIRNRADQEDRLLSARTEIAGETEIHQMTMEDGVMKMRKMAEGLAVPAQGEVVLKSGGYHLMLINLKRPLVEGEQFSATLTFEKAGPVDVAFKVLGFGASKAEGSHHDHH
jgi:periplasmic copper chaperone A